MSLAESGNKIFSWSEQRTGRRNRFVCRLGQNLAEKRNESDREGLRKAQRRKRRREKSFLIFPFAILFAKKLPAFSFPTICHFTADYVVDFWGGRKKKTNSHSEKRQKRNPKIKLLCKIKFLFQNLIPFWTVEFRRFHGNVAAEAGNVRPDEIYGKWLCRKIWISSDTLRPTPANVCTGKKPTSKSLVVFIF